MMRASFAVRCFLFAALVCGWVVLASSQEKTLWQVYAEAGETAFQRHRPSTAEAMFLSAIKEAESEGVQDPRLGKINYELGRFYSGLGYESQAKAERYSLAPFFRKFWKVFFSYESQPKAESHFRAAISVWEQCHELDTHEVAMCLNALGICLASQEKQNEAERAYRRAIGIFEKLKESSSVGIAVMNLSSTYSAQDKYSEAEKCVKEGLAFVEQSEKAEDTTVASLVERLAMVYLAQERLDGAEAAYRRLQAMGQAAKGYTKTLEQQGVDRAGELYDAKRIVEGERLLKGELALLKKQLASPSVTTADAMNEVANLHYRLHRYDEAEAEKRQTIEIAKRVLGPDIPTDWALADLALIQYAQGNGAEAESIFQSSLDSMKKRRAESKSPEEQKNLSFDIAGRLEQLAALYSEGGRNEQAAQLYKEALEIREKDISQDDPSTIATAKAYAKLLRELKRDAEASEIETRFGQVQK